MGVALSLRVEGAHEEPPANFGRVVPIEAHPRGRVRNEQVEVAVLVDVAEHKSPAHFDGSAEIPRRARDIAKTNGAVVHEKLVWLSVNVPIR